MIKYLMTYILCALHAEAAMFIDAWNLEKSDDRHFLIYENTNTKLIISGIGKLSAAIATTYLLQKYDAKKEDRLYNIGTCSSKKEEIGAFIMIGKIIDVSTNKSYLLHTKGEALSCVEKPIVSADDIQTTYGDMESVGIYIASKKFLPLTAISILKVVSDQLNPTIPKKEQILALFKPHFKVFEKVIYG